MTQVDNGDNRQWEYRAVHQWTLHAAHDNVPGSMNRLGHWQRGDLLLPLCLFWLHGPARLGCNSMHHYFSDVDVKFSSLEGVSTNTECMENDHLAEFLKGQKKSLSSKNRNRFRNNCKIKQKLFLRNAPSGNRTRGRCLGSNDVTTTSTARKRATRA